MPDNPKIDVNAEIVQIKAILARIADKLGVEVPKNDPIDEPYDYLKTFRPLTQADFDYLGSAKLPKHACGAETDHCNGVLTGRQLDSGHFRLYSDSHAYSGGAIYEFELPALFQSLDELVTCAITKQYGDVYFGKKVDDKGNFVPTLGSFRWDKATGQFYWTYGPNYATENKFGPSIGVTNSKLTSAGGPWTVHVGTNGPANTHWTRGGTIRLPSWFTRQYKTGAGLCTVGGGYYSIIEGGSAGPALLNIAELNLPAYPLVGKVVIGYPWTKDGKDFSTHADRTRKYQIDEPSWVGTPPVLDKPGKWTAGDEIGGENSAAGAVYVDAADKSGLMVFASLAEGRIAYTDGGVQVQSRSNYLYSYTPAAIRDSLLKKVAPHALPVSRSLWKLPEGFSGRIAGAHYEDMGQTLYMVNTQAYEENGSYWPVIHVYKLKA